MVRPITKASFFASSADELADVIPAAFQCAQSGRPGPVLIDVPKDVQLATTMRRAHAPPAYTAHRGNDNHAELYDRAARLIADARRPMLYVGGGVTKARAAKLVQQVAERLDIPVTMTLMALGTLPRSHPLALGMLGMHGARFTNQAIEECDLLLAIGARFDDRATGKPDRFAPHARIVHIDVDPRELGKIKEPTVAIVDDAARALQELLRRSEPQVRPAWRRRILELRERHPLRTPYEHELCSPYGIVRAVCELAPNDCIVTTDVGQHQMWVAQRFAMRRPERWLTSGGLGTMGFGLPAAIGAALAEKEASVVCFTGDGSLLMNIQELATLAELDLDVKILLLDNGALGLVRQQQQLFYRERFVGSLFAQPSNFTAIARAFGVPAIDLAETADPRTALATALAASGPALIRVPIAAEHHVLPMVAPGAANTEALDHVCGAQCACIA
jgi:acetolactate synthase-1/2/3 large subunit